MKIKKCLFIIFFTLIACFEITYSQNLQSILKDTSLNYFQIQAELYKNDRSVLKEASEKMLKRYHRWNWFWSSRVDEKGSFSVYHKKVNKYQKGG